MPPISNDAGSIIGETVVALALLGMLIVLTLQLTVTSRESRLERAQLERMGELVAELLSEARIADCAQHGPTSPPLLGTVCFAPLSHHETLEADQPGYDPSLHLTDFTVTGFNGRRTLFTVAVADTYPTALPPLHTIAWPVRTVTITDSTGRLTMKRSAVGRPS